MGSQLKEVSPTFTQLNTLISWEFCAHRHNSCQIFTALPQILLCSRSLPTCSPEICPITWAIFLCILNTGHLFSSDRESREFRTSQRRQGCFHWWTMDSEFATDNLPDRQEGVEVKADTFRCLCLGANTLSEQCALSCHSYKLLGRNGVLNWSLTQA